MAKKLVNAKVVADRLGINYARVTELCRQKLIPHIRLGRQLRFDMDEVERWVRSGGRSLDEG